MAGGGGFSLLLSSFVKAGTCRSSASYASSLLRTVTGLLSQAAASALKRSVPDDMFCRLWVSILVCLFEVVVDLITDALQA